MKLHVFNDGHGYFLNLAVKRFEEAGALDANLFVNLNDKTIYRNPHTTYLGNKYAAFNRFIKDLPELTSVTFYPFDFVAAAFLFILRKKQPVLKTGWVFWGYEFYHKPGINLLNFDQFSRQYYPHRAAGLKSLSDTGKRLVKRALGIPLFSEKLLQEGYREMDSFFSFLPEDYNNVFKQGVNRECRYFPISFLSIDEITDSVKWGGLTAEVMIGHAANPSLNHYEVLEKLHTLSFSGKIFIPLEYGEDAYRRAIKEKAEERFGSRVSFLEQRLAMHEYYRQISRIGFAVFNFRWQEGLGNILFLAWNGTKLFFKRESSVYRQFKAWGLVVYSIEDDLTAENISILLPVEERLKNKAAIEKLFAEVKVKEYWNLLINQ